VSGKSKAKDTIVTVAMPTLRGFIMPPFPIAVRGSIL
jgi:hypothetical protein